MSGLKDRAENAHKRYEEAEKKLHRADGSRLYADAEHEERVGALRGELVAELREVEEVAGEEIAAAEGALANLDASDPTTLLAPDELTTAELRRVFVNEDVAGLSERDLEVRLRSVLASGDRPSMFCHMLAGRRRAGEITRGRQEELRRRGLPTSAAAPSSGVDDALEALERALTGPKRAGEVEAVERRATDAREARALAWSLKRGGRNVGEVYGRGAYGDVGERLAGGVRA